MYLLTDDIKLMCTLSFTFRVIVEQIWNHYWNGLLGQNGLVLELNIESGLLSKVMFKIASLNPHQHRNQFFILFVFTLPTSIPVLSLFPSMCEFFVQNPSPTNGPLRETLELQSIKFEVSPNLLFGLFYVKFLALSHFFFPSQNLGFQNFFFHCCEWLVRECGYGELMAVCIRFWDSRWGWLGLRCRHWGTTRLLKNGWEVWAVLIVLHLLLCLVGENWLQGK